MNRKKDAPLVIPVFIPHSGCPHRCAFCDQSIITGQACSSLEPIDLKSIIEQYLKFRGDRSRVELAFFGGNFLGLDPREMIGLLEQAAPFIKDGLIHGIRCSTRPDTITPKTLDIISPYGVSLVELGVQSMDDAILSRLHRGHTGDHTRKALGLLKQYGIQSGVQVMVGLPGEAREGVVNGVRELTAFEPKTARIYPLVVLKGSLLAKWYRDKTFTPISLDQAVERSKLIYQIFTIAGVKVIRMGLQASEVMDDPGKVLAGPWHPAFGHLVLSSLCYDRVRARLASVLDEVPVPEKGGRVTITVHPRSESRLRGDKNYNIQKLMKAYPGNGFSIATSSQLSLDGFHLNVEPKGHGAANRG